MSLKDIFVVAALPIILALASIIGPRLIDGLPRREILLCGISFSLGMILSLLLIAFLIGRTNQTLIQSSVEATLTEYNRTSATVNPVTIDEMTAAHETAVQNEIHVLATASAQP
jgi:hypothetical protein